MMADYFHQVDLAEVGYETPDWFWFVGRDSKVRPGQAFYYDPAANNGLGGLEPGIYIFNCTILSP